MPSERIQRRIDSVLDQADEAIEGGRWRRAQQRVEDALALDPGNADVQATLDAAARLLAPQARWRSSRGSPPRISLHLATG